MLDLKLHEKNQRFQARPDRHHYYNSSPYENRHYSSFRRERRREGFNWPRSQYPSTAFTDDFGSYMRSFGFSVHMDPNSAESRAKRAQFQADNVQWQKEWAGVDPESQKARAELRKENMRDRLKRDVEDSFKDTIRDPGFADIIDRVVNESLEGLNFGFETPCEEEAMMPDHVETCNPADVFNQSAYDKARASRSNDKNEVDSGSKSGSCSTTSRQSTPSDLSDGGSSTSGTSTTHDSHFSYHCSGSESTTDHFETTFEAFNAATEVFNSVTEEADAAVDQMHDSYKLEQDSMVPLLPYFNQKLADPSGRYTTDDYVAEMNGVILEIYCGWLEAARLSVPNALPVPAQNNTKQCSHLGLWHKEFCRPKCEVCDFWTPIFLLTCPSCGVKACVRCKFAIMSPKT